MKGLLIKDFGLITSSKRTIPMFILIAVMLLITGDEDSVSFVTSFFTMICGMLVISTISYDDFDHSNTFLMTLPVTRKLYVIEKYVFSLIMMTFGFVVSIIASYVTIIIKSYDVDILSWLEGCLVIFAVFIILLSIMLPVQLKFGGENGKIVIVGMMAVIFIIVFGAKKILQMSRINTEKTAEYVINNILSIDSTVLIFVGVGVGILFVMISILLSINIMNKKEF